MALGLRYQLDHKDTKPGELPRGKDFGRHVQLKEGSVPDQNPAFRGQMQRVMINTQTDPLESEYSRGNVSQAGYAAGRTYQRVLEKARPPVTGAGQWVGKDRVDFSAARDLSIWHNLANASEAEIIINDARQVCGIDGEKLLELVLVEGKTFRELAGVPRKWRAESEYRKSFARSLERLADYWAVYGSYGL